MIVPPGIPIYPVAIGNPDLASEVLIAYEAGIRVQQTESFSWDLAVFFHDYDDIVGSAAGPTMIGSPPFPYPYIPLTVQNGIEAESYGFELFGTYEVQDGWTVSASYSLLRMLLHTAPGLSGGEAAEGESPQNQLYMRSSWDLTRTTKFDLIGRYTDSLSAFNVPSYFTMDTRLAWRPSDQVEVVVIGKNLLDAAQPEYGNDSFTGNVATQTQREVVGMVVLRY